MKPEIVCAQLQQYLTQIRALLVHSPRFAPSVERLDKLQAQLADMTGNCDTFTAQALSLANNDMRRVARGATQTRDAIRQKTDRSRYSRADKKALQALIALDDKLKKFQPVVDKYVAAEGRLNSYTTGYAANRKRNLSAMRRIVEANAHPGYGDCATLNFPAASGAQARTYTDFVWLGMQYEKAKAVGADGSAPVGQYRRTYERLRKELRDTLPGNRAAFAQYMSQYEGYLLSEANKSLRKISGGRSELTPEEMAKAIRDPAFTQAAAFRAFRRSLESDPLLARYMRDARRETIGRDYAAAEKAVGQIFAPKTRNPRVNDAIEDRRTALRNEVAKSGYTTVSEKGRMFELYDKLCSLDTGKNSGACQAMATSLRAVIDRRGPIDENDPDFQKAMLDCERAARDYVTTQPKKPRTALGRDRLTAANTLMSMARGYTEPYSRRQEKATEAKKHELQEQLRQGIGGSRQQKRIELSKLQKVIAPVHTVPKIAKAVNTVSGIRKSGVGHKIANVANVVLTNTGGLVAGAISEIVTHQSDKGTSLPYDPQLVPGGNGEKYSDSTDENGLFNDRRKIPLVWAQEIPEEPVKDIEFAIEVDQAKEGTDLGSSNGNGFQEKDAIGDKGAHFGHAFISLKYTQKDPVTGQPKRYKTSFGFYPNDAFNTFAQGMNSAQYGAMQVGKISNDFGHEVSAGQSFKITPEQFNKIVTLTQNYEKGGYNMLSRNCVSFTKACVDEIGLEEAKELYEETDLNSGMVLHNAGTAIVPLGAGYSAKAIAKNEMYKLQDADAYSYQRYGQKLVSKEDLKQQDMVSYNFRAKGYSPGLLGEKIREKSDVPLHASKWEGTKGLQDRVLHSPLFTNSRIYNDSVKKDMDEKKKTDILKQIADQYSKQYNLLCLEEQVRLLQHKVRSLPDFDVTDPDNKAALDKMQAFSDNLLDAMSASINQIDINNNANFSNLYLYKSVNYPMKKQAFHDLTAACKAYTEGMDEIFRKTFRSDPRLNLEFNKAVSFAERISNTAAQEYSDFVKKDHIGFTDLQMLEGELDTSREALRSTYDTKFRDKLYFFTEKKPNGDDGKMFATGYRLSPLEAYAAVKVCGSLGDAIKMNDKRQSADPEKYYDMKKRYGQVKLTEQNTLIRSLGKSMEYKLAPDYKPTDEDYEMIFDQLPSSECQLKGGRICATMRRGAPILPATR